MSMYIRVKRQKQTIFLHCEPSDTILSLKKKIRAINNVPEADQRLMIIDEKTICDEAKTVKDCKIEDAGTIALVYKKSTEPVEWEDIDITKPDAPPEESAQAEHH